MRRPRLLLLLFRPAWMPRLLCAILGRLLPLGVLLLLRLLLGLGVALLPSGMQWLLWGHLTKPSSRTQ